MGRCLQGLAPNHRHPLRSTHGPSEVQCKLNRHRGAVLTGFAQIAPPIIGAGRPSRCAGGRRVRVLHSGPARVAKFARLSLSSEAVNAHARPAMSQVIQVRLCSTELWGQNSSFSCPQHPCLTLPSRGRHKGRFAPFAPPLMSNVRAHFRLTPINPNASRHRQEIVQPSPETLETNQHEALWLRR